MATISFEVPTLDATRAACDSITRSARGLASEYVTIARYVIGNKLSSRGAAQTLKRGKDTVNRAVVAYEVAQACGMSHEDITKAPTIVGAIVADRLDGLGVPGIKAVASKVLLGEGKGDTVLQRWDSLARPAILLLNEKKETGASKEEPEVSHDETDQGSQGDVQASGDAGEPMSPITHIQAATRALTADGAKPSTPGEVALLNQAVKALQEACAEYVSRV